MTEDERRFSDEWAAAWQRLDLRLALDVETLRAADAAARERQITVGERIDVHVHIDCGSADRKLDLILAHLETIDVQERASAKREVAMTTTMADLVNKAGTTLQAVRDESDKDTAIITLVEGQTALITGLKEQLAAAIASNDPALLDSVMESLTAAETSAISNGARVLEAVNANTPPAAAKR